MNLNLIAAVACAACIGCQAAVPTPVKSEEPAPVVVAAAPAVAAPQPAVLPDPNGPAPEPTAAVSPQFSGVEAPSAGAVRQEGNKLKLPGVVLFEVGRARLKPESEPVLASLNEYLGAKPHITLVRIEGHSDSQGSSGANQTLSGERALAIRNWLVQNGVASSRLVAVGFGETKPIADNATAEGRAMNRRMEFLIVEVNGRPWLGADPLGGGTPFGPNPR